MKKLLDDMINSIALKLMKNATKPKKYHRKEILNRDRITNTYVFHQH